MLISFLNVVVALTCVPSRHFEGCKSLFLKPSKNQCIKDRNIMENGQINLKCLYALLNTDQYQGGLNNSFSLKGSQLYLLKKPSSQRKQESKLQKSCNLTIGWSESIPLSMGTTSMQMPCQDTRVLYVLKREFRHLLRLESTSIVETKGHP